MFSSNLIFKIFANKIYYYGFNYFPENVSKMSAAVINTFWALFSLLFLAIFYINAFWIYIIVFYYAIPLFVVGIIMFLFKNTLVIE